VGLSLDTFHMNMEEGDIAGAIAMAGRHIFHVQANENHRGYLGTGHMDWTAIARALNRADYTGPVTLEPFRRTDERISIPFAQWKPPGEDEQEALAASRRFMSDILHLAGRNG
jgi:D-psicose/D-tagatose/L-ribulose 3-epimerase